MLAYTFMRERGVWGEGWGLGVEMCFEGMCNCGGFHVREVR